ncbi:coenzyme F420-0:L-glutamate ligase [Nocardioides humilatus]|uniref:Coenzyme F420-0:L-glutamate ligase n=1 Tax=Nocardioides humilatus TaxID=2607660 RepID=A0A5B1LK22_9ACTN|nr:coenzyme F420-0:L-glutamate ligase [Nocardioides humilatus]KAA1421061.1 coenzyme F420-0:L-glutamate ligase [Nocardioides humilatus]
MPTLTVTAPDGVAEVGAGADLADLLLPHVELDDGDIVVVTSKVVSKAEGRVVEGDREDWITAETVRLVARRGPTRIVRNRLGLTMAAAGVDASNVTRGAVVLLPEDPDASAARLRAVIAERTGRNVGVIVTDTAGRAWREGQTDIAIGAAGLLVLESFEGRVDAHGNELAVTAPAVADEIASVAELAQGKLGGRPFAVVRGRADLVLPAGDDGTGSKALIREDGADMFGYGAREAVVRALVAAPGDDAPFGAPVTAEEFLDLLTTCGVPARVDGATVRCGSEHEGRATILGFAHGWSAQRDPGGVDLRFHRTTP